MSNWMIALTREATPDDDRRWQMLMVAGDPRKQGRKVGDKMQVEGQPESGEWLIADIFRA